MRFLYFFVIFVFIAPLLASDNHKFNFSLKIENPKTMQTASIETEFLKAIQKHASAKAEFDKLKKTAEERSGGRYGGYNATEILLASYTVRKLAKNKATNKEEKRIALYFSFNEGQRLGMKVTQGVFAVFDIEIVTKYLYDNLDNATLQEAAAKAKFRGFTNTLNIHSDEE